MIRPRPPTAASAARDAHNAHSLTRPLFALETCLPLAIQVGPLAGRGSCRGSSSGRHAEQVRAGTTGFRETRVKPFLRDPAFLFRSARDPLNPQTPQHRGGRQAPGGVLCATAAAAAAAAAAPVQQRAGGFSLLLKARDFQGVDHPPRLSHAPLPSPPPFHPRPHPHHNHHHRRPRPRRSSSTSTPRSSARASRARTALSTPSRCASSGGGPTGGGWQAQDRGGTTALHPHTTH
jgi:hypothetical protein